jgi:hypothetical protein
LELSTQGPVPGIKYFLQIYITLEFIEVLAGHSPGEKEGIKQ